METILVIGNDPALAETLASELPGFAVTGIHPKDAEDYMHKDNFHLIVVDGDVNLADHTQNIITLSRPIRLSDAIYTITRKFKSKTALPKEETEISSNLLFSLSERLIRSIDNGITIPLTEKEAELLHQFIENKAISLQRDTLLKKIWGYGDDINTHTLETHIYRLRSKLKQANEVLDIIFSEETGGYQLRTTAIP